MEACRHPKHSLKTYVIGTLLHLMPTVHGMKAFKRTRKKKKLSLGSSVLKRALGLLHTTSLNVEDIKRMLTIHISKTS